MLAAERKSTLPLLFLANTNSFSAVVLTDELVVEAVVPPALAENPAELLRVAPAKAGDKELKGVNCKRSAAKLPETLYNDAVSALSIEKLKVPGKVC